MAWSARSSTATSCPPLAPPITISWVIDHTSGGRLGLCHCPGKTIIRGSQVLSARDLATDLAALKSHGVTGLVCLLNTAELRVSICFCHAHLDCHADRLPSLQCYGLRDYDKEVQERGILLLCHPIIEMCVPDSFEAAAAFVNDLVTELEAGHVLAMHCREGIGRAGMMAACCMLRLGMAASSAEAIREVRRLRCPTAVETARQEQFVKAYDEFLKAGRPNKE